MQTTIMFLLLVLSVACAIRSSLPNVNQVGRFHVAARYDDSTTEGNDEVKTGIQFMITRKMRNTLRDELGYNDDEIDDMEPQIAAVVIEKSLNRPKKGMPASWRRSSSGGFLEYWKRLPLLKRLNSLRKGAQRGLQDVGYFLYEQSQRPVVRSALLLVALVAAREPIMQGANAAAQVVVDKWNALTNRRHRLSAYQLTPQYSQRSLKSVLDSQHQAPGFRRERSGWLRWPSLSFGHTDSSGARLGKLVDINALSRVQQLSLWDKLCLRVARWKRG